MAFCLELSLDLCKRIHLCACCFQRCNLLHTPLGQHLGLLLGTEAAVMTPDGVNFSFLVFWDSMRASESCCSDPDGRLQTNGPVAAKPGPFT